MISAARRRRFRIAVRKYPAFESAITAQWKAFEARRHTGLQLELVPLDLHPLEHALFAEQGMARGDWDIAFVPTDWIAAMNAQNCAVDLAPLLQKDPPPEYPRGWSPSLLRLQRIGRRILGVPFHDGPESLVYRTDLFTDPTLTRNFRSRFRRELAPPQTWDDFHRIARFFQQPENNLYGTIFAAHPDGHNTVYDFLLQLWTRNGELISRDGSIRFSTPQAVAALRFYRKILTDEKAIHPASHHADSVSAGLRFAAGEVAMMVNWFGFAAHAHASPESSVRGRIGVTAIPSGASDQSVSLNVYWILALPTGSPHREIAWKFLRHTQTPAMDKITSLSGAIGCRRSTWRDPDVLAAVPLYRAMPKLHRHAREIPTRLDWPRIASIIDALITRTITTTTPVETLLREADAAFNSQP